VATTNLDRAPSLIWQLLRNAAERRLDAPALLAPRRTPMSYGRLWDLVQQVAGTLHAVGIGPGDRVAVALPNGPEMASSFLAISAAAVCAPLNPNYRSREFEFYLSDLNPKALVVQAGANSTAAAVARSCGIRVIELVPQFEAEAGVFCFNGISSTQVNPFASHRGDDAALILHTSGTTSRPKMVPLTQANLCASARNIVASLSLTADDRCLNVMPLFHIHGLVGAVLSTVAAGSSVVCAPDFHSLRFFDWLEGFQPTWYTAVPTIHRAILARAAQKPGIHSRSRLRFIRSCSAALPPKLMTELEDEFRVPVVEAYGMTEATHQVSANPLPPGIRKPGSVGLPVGCEIAVLDKEGALLPTGEIGIVAIRGSNVIHGYKKDPQASKDCVNGGWFHTGDLGKLDSAGYLFLTGRSKEVINRGGEKVSPREVEEVLLEHPAVAQAVAFAAPNVELGEDVAAAVVLHKPRERSEDGSLEIELRGFVAKRLTSVKVPRQIVVVEKIPVGPTGKPQRIGMAAKLGFAESAPASMAGPHVSAQSELELQIAKIWEELLDIRPIGVRQNFFELGGDSLLALEMIALLETLCGIRLPETGFLLADSVETLAGAVLRAMREEIRSPIVAIQPQGAQPPLFFLHGQWRGGGLYCRELARRLGDNQPFFAIVPHGLDGRPVPRTIEAMAADRVQHLLRAHPEGPIRLGGYCNGALIAFEMARQLQDLGREVDLLVIVETHAPNAPFKKIGSIVQQASALLSLDRQARAKWFLRLRDLQIRLQKNVSDLAISALRKLGRIAKRTGGILQRAPNAATFPGMDARPDAYADPYDAIDCYVPGPYKGPVVLLRTEDMGSKTANFTDPDDPTAGWAQLAPQVQVYRLAGTHDGIVREYLDELARGLAQCVNHADSLLPRAPAELWVGVDHPDLPIDALAPSLVTPNPASRRRKRTPEESNQSVSR